MILIADSGSTKTDWQIIEEGRGVCDVQTSGINPYHLTLPEIIQLLKTDWKEDARSFSAIYFYGAGCTPAKKTVMQEALSAFFDSSLIEVHSDLLAAARALCLKEKGIVCILGTGSNSCYYDGVEIVSQVSPLGYVLGDEGSGAVLGRILLGDILKNQLPQELINAFYAFYSTSPAEIIEQVYRKPLANKYLAGYTYFLSEHIRHPAIRKLVKNEIGRFFSRNILQYKESATSVIHFTGSIAFVFEDLVREVAEEMHVKTGDVTQSPAKGLVQYHTGNFFR